MCSGHLKIILWENASQKPGDKVVGITSIWKKSLYYMAFQNYAILHQKIQNAKFNLTLQNPKSPAKIQNLGRLLHKFRAIQSRCLGLRGSSSHWEPVWTKTLGKKGKQVGNRNESRREQKLHRAIPPTVFRYGCFWLPLEAFNVTTVLQSNVFVVACPIPRKLARVGHHRRQPVLKNWLLRNAKGLCKMALYKMILKFWTAPKTFLHNDCDKKSLQNAPLHKMRGPNPFPNTKYTA